MKGEIFMLMLLLSFATVIVFILYGAAGVCLIKGWFDIVDDRRRWKELDERGQEFTTWADHGIGCDEDE